MAPNAPRIVTLLERALTVSEPTRSLATLTELRRELDALERVHVARALQAGESFAAVAKPLGISRQAAHRRYRDLTAPPRRQTLSPEARTALLRAREEATRYGSVSIDSTHLLLAIAARARAGRRRGAPRLRPARGQRGRAVGAASRAARAADQRRRPAAGRPSAARGARGSGRGAAARPARYRSGAPAHSKSFLTVLMLRTVAVSARPGLPSARISALFCMPSGHHA